MAGIITTLQQSFFLGYGGGSGAIGTDIDLARQGAALGGMVANLGWLQPILAGQDEIGVRRREAGTGGAALSEGSGGQGHGAAGMDWAGRLGALKAVMAGSASPGPALYGRLLAAALACFGLSRALAAELRGGGLCILAGIGLDACRFQDGRPLAETFATELVRTGQVVSCAHAGADLQPGMRAWSDAAGCETCFAAPVRVHGRIHGMICLMDPAPRDTPFTAADIALLELFAHTLGELIAQARLSQEHAAVEAQQQEAAALFATAFRHAPIGMALVDLHGRWLKVNPAACRLTGYEEAELLGRDVVSTACPDDADVAAACLEALGSGACERYGGEARQVRKDGCVVWARLDVALVRDACGAPRYLIWQMQDIDAQKRLLGELEAANRRLVELANVDPLTGALNRRALRTRLAREIEQAVARRRALSFLMVDVDRFKSYNDHHGHVGGDAALKRIAQCLKDTVRAADAIGRFGGEEFLVLLPGAGRGEAKAVAERMRRIVADCHDFAERVTVSIGVHTLEPDGTEAPLPNALIAKADQALYTAKRHGRNRVVVA